jgi:hypothetical protein
MCCATVSAAVLATQHKSLDSSLPFFFLQKGHVQSVKFTQMEDEIEIHAHWEAVHGELTQEWKHWHWEAVKSQQRQGGECVE